jgi:hypothetical protein
MGHHTAQLKRVIDDFEFGVSELSPPLSVYKRNDARIGFPRGKTGLLKLSRSETLYRIRNGHPFFRHIHQ